MLLILLTCVVNFDHIKIVKKVTLAAIHDMSVEVLEDFLVLLKWQL